MTTFEVSQQHAILLANVRGDANKAAEIRRVSSEALTPTEYDRLEPWLGLTRDCPASFKRIRAPPHYSLELYEPLLRVIDAIDLTTNYPLSPILQKSLTEFATDTFGRSLGEYARQNARNVCARLDNAQANRVARRYPNHYMVHKVLDLYLFTEREIENFAYSHRIPFGEKSMASLNNILRSFDLARLCEIIHAPLAETRLPGARE